MLVQFEDVTDRRRTEGEKDILLAETRHRMRNLLATVRALANQTATENRSATEYRDAFLGRFHALMDAQDLSLSGRSTANFADLVHRMAALGAPENAFVCQGPSVTVAAAQVLPLTLILHELSTNALKYGALSARSGIVRLNWSVAETTAGQRALQIEWREENGPPVTRPKGEGFGSKLLDFSVKDDLQGTVDLQFPPEGFRCSIYVPIG